MRKLLANIIEADKRFKLINPGDRICVGVSGGKDSMLLLYALKLYQKIFASRHDQSFSIVGVHLKLSLCHVEYAPMVEFWKKEKVEFILADTIIGKVLRENMKNNRFQCSLCSKFKKAILIAEAKKAGCNKIAMGHHGDDAIETLFMNMINNGKIATFTPKMYLDRDDMNFIRPFVLAREKDIANVAKNLEIPIVPCSCPMEGFTQRDLMKDFLQKKFYDDKKWKIAYHNFLTALSNEKNLQLWFDSQY